MVFKLKKNSKGKDKGISDKEGILRRGTEIDMYMSFIFNDQRGKFNWFINRVENSRKNKDSMRNPKRPGLKP